MSHVNEASAAGRAYAALKTEILDCTLAPGSPLFEGEIADRLEVSKTPVREALGMLVHEGLVQVRPRQGYRVTDVTLGDVQEVFQLRQLLEPAAAELAAERASPDHLQTLRANSEGEADQETQLRRAAIFHGTLADASGNRRLAAALHRILDETQRFRFLGLTTSDTYESETAEHRELLDALLKGNHHLARDIAQRHVEEDRMRMFEAILGSLSTSGSSDATSQLRLRPEKDPERVAWSRRSENGS
jgi:GntR family transcriptional regulator, rspAB operon transcriptional repressor